ncbi:MAG: S24 family peptidase [Bryobacterales bacterium]|nr:S24 family peptidase [Bryobacterales bacterium]
MAAGRAGGTPPVETTRADFAVLELHAPGQAGVPAGILLLDPSENRLHVKLLERWPASLHPEDARVLRAIAAELAERAAAEPGDALLAEMEGAFSHLLRLSARATVTLQKPERELNALFRRHVAAHTAPREAPAAIVPFRTHLPFYPMKIAAGLFDGDAEVEAAAWVPIPEGQRPDERLFVARISGRSMEPRIPDGSYCLFRMNPQGSREGKLVLAQQFGSSQSGGAFSIKKYHSEKAPQRPAGDDDFGDAEWRHSRVRLISLNPLYPSWDLLEGECRILAELVRILSDDEVPDDLRDAAPSAD